MTTAYFSQSSLDFLRQLAGNNNRAWFDERKQDYENLVRSPALDFIADMEDAIEELSPHFRAIPKKVGGSLMRPYRDVRFGKDKRPFKTNVGIQFRHFMAKDVHAPGFYLHVEPDNCFIGVGIWRPDGAALAKLRAAIDETPEDWLGASNDGAFIRKFELRGDMLTNQPRGYAKDHPLIGDLKRKDFIAVAELPEKHVTGKRLKPEVVKAFQTAVPYMRFLCRALELPF